MKIDLDEFLAMMQYRNLINNAKLKEIELYSKGKLVPIKQKDLDHWQFIGLSNCDFIANTKEVLGNIK